MKSLSSEAPVKEEDVRSVWLPLPEWRMATGSANLSSECLTSWRKHGQRDYDTKIWLRISDEIGEEVGDTLSMNEVNGVHA